MDTKRALNGTVPLRWRPVADGAELTGMDGEPAVLSVPDRLEGLPVVAVAPSAFQGRRTLREVALPQSLRAIGANAFAGCAGLRKAALPEEMDAIGASAFQGCAQLSEAALPEGLTEIAPRAFYGCARLRRARVPSGVTAIGERAFAGCAALCEVLLPEGLTAIGSNAFSGCSALESLRIPETVTDISADALPAGLLRGGMLVLPAQGLLVRGEIRPVSEISDDPRRRFIVPEGIRVIGDRALADNPNMLELCLPEGLLRIGSRALEGCSGLRGIALPDGVEALGAAVFRDCARLSEVALPRGLTELPDAAFQRCGRLERIELPGTLRTIGERAFEGCSSLREMRLPDAVRAVGAHAFYRCAGLERLELSAGLEALGDGALSGCAALRELVLWGRYDPALYGVLSEVRRAALIAPNDPPEAFPGLWRKRVCLGYARSLGLHIPYAPGVGEACLRWMRSHGAAFVGEALRDPALMHLLADNGCLSLRDARALLERASGERRTEYVMTLLDYIHHVSGIDRGGPSELW